jgi:CDP-glucose 4,6-dehydratase
VRPEVIFHLAAQPLVLDSYSNPRETFDINMMGTVNLLEVARRVESVKSVLVSTTDKVYKNVENKNKFVESDSLLGKDPYSASKVGVENIILAYQQFSKISDSPTVTALRSGNVIGGGDISRNRLIPDLIKSFSNDSVAMIRNPNSTRPWQHALDPLIGYVLTANAILSGKEINSINFTEITFKDFSSNSLFFLYYGEYKNLTLNYCHFNLN